MRLALVDVEWAGHHTPYAGYLARYLLEQGHQVSFLTDKRHERIDEIEELEGTEGLDIRKLDIPRESWLSKYLTKTLYDQYIRTKQLRTIFDELEGEQFDLVHFLYYDNSQIPLYLASNFGRSLNWPVVATLHRDLYLGVDSVFDRIRRGIISQIVTQTVKSNEGVAITVGVETMRQRLLGAHPELDSVDVQTAVIPSPLKEINIGKQAARDELDLPSDDPLFLFFGELRYEKGPDILAEALENIDKRIYVLYAGSEGDFDGDDLKEWKARANDSVKILERLEFIPDEDLPYYFKAADALVLPYRRTRGISGPLRQASRAGVPSIANRDSDVGYIVDQEDLGLTFQNKSVSDLRDTLTNMLEIETDSDTLQQFACSRNWKEAGTQIDEVYQRIQGDRGTD